MNQPDESALSLSDRRRSDREESNSHVRVTIDAATFGGKAENVSPAGVFFFSTEQIRVRVELTDETGVLKHCTGRLRRVERMSDDETGFAIQFDRA
jgi:hypothetical protein